MLNEVIVSQGILNGIRVITTAMMVACLLLGLGVAGLVSSRRLASPGRGRQALGVVSKGLVGLGLILAAGLVALLAVAALESRPKPIHWDLDLTGRPSLQAFRIQKCSERKNGETMDIDCIFEGVISLSARFPKGRAVQESGHALWAEGENNNLTSLHLFLSPMSQSELEAKLARLFADWEVPPTALEEWRSEGTTKRRYFTTREEQRDLPWLEVSVSGIDSPRDASRPWTASLKWHWIQRD